MPHLTKCVGLLLSLTLITSCTALTKKKDASGKIENSEPEPPKLTKPIVKRIWVKDSINDDGTEYTTGHWKYILEKKSVWSK